MRVRMACAGVVVTRVTCAHVNRSREEGGCGWVWVAVRTRPTRVGSLHRARTQSRILARPRPSPPPPPPTPRSIKTRQADDETRALLIKMAGAGAVGRGWVYFTEIKTIPVEDLQTVSRDLDT